MDGSQFLQVKPPLMLIDRIDELVPGKYAKGYKLLREDDPLQYQAFPETLQSEVFAQMSIIAIESLPNIKAGEPTRLFEWKTRFHDKVFVGQRFDVTATILSWKRGIIRSSCKGYVQGRCVSEGSFQLVVPRLFDLYKVRGGENGGRGKTI